MSKHHGYSASEKWPWWSFGLVSLGFFAASIMIYIATERHALDRVWTQHAFVFALFGTGLAVRSLIAGILRYRLDKSEGTTDSEQAVLDDAAKPHWK
jgi:hypothetical protein